MAKKSEAFKFTIEIEPHSITDRDRYALQLGNTLTKFCKLSLGDAVVKYKGKVVAPTDIDRGIGLSGE